MLKKTKNLSIENLNFRGYPINRSNSRRAVVDAADGTSKINI